MYISTESLFKKPKGKTNDPFKEGNTGAKQLVATDSTSLKVDPVTLFKDGLEYKDQPRLLDIAQNTPNELAQYLKASSISQRLFKNNKPKVVDLCAGTGLFSMHILETITAREIVLIDQDSLFLDVCRARLRGYPNVIFRLADSVGFSLGDSPADSFGIGLSPHT
jgi:SAM-dependent methyltransferase